MRFRAELMYCALWIEGDEYVDNNPNHYINGTLIDPHTLIIIESEDE